MKKLLLIPFMMISMLLIAQDSGFPERPLVYTKQHDVTEELSDKYQAIKDERQYITAEMIRLQGIARLSELLIWIDKSTFSTINGDRFYLNLKGTSNAQQQNFLLFINGQKVELERWDALNINLLGIAVTDIAYIEIFNTPGIFSGQFIGKGAIHIVTRNDHKGLTYQVYSNFGNPVNDEGAAQYIQGYQSPNVDKIGLVYAHSLGYYGSKGHANLTYHYQDWFVRDTMILARYRNFTSTSFKNSMRAIRFEGALQAGKTLFEGGVAVSEQNEFLFRNFQATEIPSNTGYFEGRFSASHALSAVSVLKTSVSFNRHDFAGLQNFQPVFYNYTYHTFTTSTEYASFLKKTDPKSGKYYAGYTIEYASYHRPVGYQLQHKPYMRFQYMPTKKITRHADLVLNMFKGTLNPSLAFRQQKTNNAISSWTFTASYQATRLSQQLNQLWYFYYGNNLAGNPYPVSISSRTTHHLTADYFYILSLGKHFKITLHGGAQHQRNVSFVRPLPVLLPSIDPGQNTQGQQAAFTTIIIGTNIHYDVFRNFWIDVDYYSANDRSGNKELQQLLDQDARRKLVTTAVFNLPSGFDIALRNQVISKTKWLNYDGQGVLYMQTLNSIFTTDISINKKLWRKRINLNASVRNLFNQEEQYHPLGAEFTLRYYVTASFRLADINKKMLKP